MTPEAVGEPRVLGRREDPAGALELADPAQPLEPRRVEQVLLGDRPRRAARPRADFGRRQALGQLDVAVDRVADEVDRAERVARASRPPASRRRSAQRPAGACRRRRPAAPPARGPRRRRPTTGSRGGSRSFPTTVARQSSEPSASASTVWVGCQVASRTRLATVGAKRSDDVDRRLVRDDVPGPLAASDATSSPRPAARTSAGVSATSPDPLDLERPQRVARLVAADQVERVGLERRLDQVRPDGRARAAPRSRS